MPVRDDPGVDALRKFITGRDAQLEILLAGPIDDAHAAQIVGIARDIEGYALPRLSSQLERDNAQGLRDTTAGFQRLRARTGVALGAVFGALVIHLALLVFADLHLLRNNGRASCWENGCKKD